MGHPVQHWVSDTLKQTQTQNNRGTMGYGLEAAQWVTKDPADANTCAYFSEMRKV
jgi:hypothetical protein